MANFDHQTLEYLKKLCRIDLSKEEERDIEVSLTRILKYVESLKDVNTDKTKTCRYILRGMLKNRMREDEIKNLLSREKFLENAPEQIGGMVRVPPVLKGSS
ncbi:MAG: glutamyl-tRNA(Gln) amidotransferase subunit C [uncultured bacterium]|nr:MAG: glutamyl-tRNA(Gln) amidotransferase subunit C [uncultured bacterium]OGN56001.1 MAG: glutamyl-tRNA amidotransferase [Chlamydiae bacterium RIFCSPHIGHO2_01_FULL_44_39]OGN58564.1 MAG: glutamyl-tRNA amidotransferase [Chlamydiae bacterium RIFCSPHIGHO2_02_FULL_45_9]OGN60617.1 MAG: glutamyl-tRNA amidotransferase [Chlamydiae bacterium RIFCSPHIGHO2_12_FULL_44_59]OGN66434.1 MAG: glutamyl-tRNA amidotransferase [Chlamydiae bacterium RIFCSPLOWO2_01_FULL_44_52]OGN69496.1 MAG: glutamyl-tRNA amidotrans